MNAVFMQKQNYWALMATANNRTESFFVDIQAQKRPHTKHG
jgi:hypothetical protein